MDRGQQALERLQKAQADWQNAKKVKEEAKHNKTICDARLSAAWEYYSRVKSEDGDIDAAVAQMAEDAKEAIRRLQE